MTGLARHRIALALAVMAWTGLTTALAAPEPLANAAMKRGELLYARCMGCHSIDANRTGPLHCGLFGRRAGSVPGFSDYSKAMRDSGIVWDSKNLDAFLADPVKRVPGTTMGYAGVRDPRERAELIAWLGQVTRRSGGCRVAP